MTGWFSEDFTLAEIKTLYAKERIPEIRPGNALFDGHLPHPDPGGGRGAGAATRRPGPAARSASSRRPSTRSSSNTRAGSSAAAASAWTPARCWWTGWWRWASPTPTGLIMQSFELANLIELQTRIMPAAGVDLPLIQLLGGSYDIAFNLDPANAALGGNTSAYAGFNFALRPASADPTTSTSPPRPRSRRWPPSTRRGSGRSRTRSCPPWRDRRRWTGTATAGRRSRGASPAR